MSIKNKEKNFVSAVVYMYNNVEALKSFLPLLFRTLKDNFEKYEIICVNDATEDDCVQQVRKIASANENPTITVVNMGTYQGLELSMTAGVDIAIGDFVYEFDNLHLSYSEELIMSMYYKSLKGNDIVLAVPQSTVGVFSKLFYNIYNKNSIGSNMIKQDVCHIISRRAINRVLALNKTIPYRKAAYSKCGLNCDDIVFENDILSKRLFNKKAQKVRQETAFESLALFTDTIQKVSAWITGAFLLFTIVVGLYAFGVYFSVKKPVEGWTFTILFLSIAFFGMFLLMTIMLKYMAVLLNIVFKRQKYLVDSIEKITNN